MELANGRNVIRIRYTEECSKLIDNRIYEPLVLELMNRSTRFFSDKPIRHIEDQSHGESDFVDSNGRKYEVKSIIDSNQGRMLGRDVNKDIEGFFKEIISELAEFGNRMQKTGEVDVESTKLYMIVKQRVEAVGNDEAIILYIPFPLFPEIEGLAFWGRFTDCAQVVYEKLVENDIIGNREFFYIYPMQDGVKYVLRNGKTREKEFIPLPDYSKFLNYERMN